tara:strand:- start:444 stop:779 length:336 start_codon:yes stop_codon:yes gene_type:complete
MFNSKLFISLSVFSIFMIFTSVIKTTTRIIEKKIIKHERKNANLENNLYESYLDYIYLSSPESISNKIKEFKDQDYVNIEYSQIYFSLEHFINEQNKTTKSYINEKKIQKK